MSTNEEPILISAFDNVRKLTQYFSAEYYAVIMVVDKFGQQNYIGIQLAEPQATW